MDIPSELKEFVNNICKIIHTAAEATILSASDTTQCFYSVLKGKVKKSAVFVMHKEHIFCVR